jgi:hypothetical protein
MSDAQTKINLLNQIADLCDKRDDLEHDLDNPWFDGDKREVQIEIRKIKSEIARIGREVDKL